MPVPLRLDIYVIMKRDLPTPAEMLGRAEPDNLEVAARLALEKLTRMDAATQAEHCGAVMAAGGLDLVYLGTPIRVRLPGWSVEIADGPAFSPYEQVLVLHYLSSDEPVPPEADPISFSDVPSGEFYTSAFDRRARIPLLRAFGERPERVVAPALAMGGRSIERGDVGVAIPAFPRIEVILAFWRGDEEFSPEVSVLFSNNVASFLPTEDIAHLAGIVTERVIKGARK